MQLNFWSAEPKPVRSCVTFQFPNTSVKECSCEWLVNMGPG